MYRVIKPRGTGKTSELMHLAEETGATIVCSNPYAFKAKAHDYGFNDDLKFISYEEYLSTRTAGCDELYLIDEIDGLFRYTPGKVIGYCLTPDD